MEKGSYWDIDDFLSEEEKVVTVNEVEIKGLGFVDCSNKQEDLPEKAKVTLPLWLAQFLSMRVGAKLEIPKYLNESYKTVLRADPTIVSLKDQSPYFFEVGTKLAELLGTSDVNPLLLRVFLERVKYLLDYVETKNNPAILKKLTVLEASLFENARKSTWEMEQWRERKYDRIATSKVLFRPKKRKTY